MNQWQLYKLIIKVFSVTILNSSFTFYGISMTTMLILIVVMGIVHTHEKNIKQQWNSKIVCDYDIFIKIFFIRFFIRIYSIRITTIQPRSRDFLSLFFMKYSGIPPWSFNSMLRLSNPMKSSLESFCK